VPLGYWVQKNKEEAEQDEDEVLTDTAATPPPRRPSQTAAAPAGSSAPEVVGALPLLLTRVSPGVGIGAVPGGLSFGQAYCNMIAAGFTHELFYKDAHRQAGATPPSADEFRKDTLEIIKRVFAMYGFDVADSTKFTGTLTAAEKLWQKDPNRLNDDTLGKG